MNNIDASSLILQQCVQIAVVVFVVWVLAKSVLRIRPQLTYLLWMMVLLKCTIPPLGSAAFSVWNLLLPGHRETAIETNSLSQPPSESVVPQEVHSTAPQTEAVISRNVNSTLSFFPAIPTIVVIVWSCGLLVLIVVTLRAIRQVNQLVRTNACADNTPLVQMVSDVASELGLRRIPQCVVLDCPLGPAVRGVLQPQLLFPKALLDQTTTEQLRLIVLHELLHIRRGDILAGYFQAFVQICWWFHPAVWIAGRQCSHDRERCNDDGVLEVSKAPSSTYAQCLLEAARACRTPPWVPTVMGISGMTAIRRRLEYIMLPSRRRTPTWIMCCTVVSAALLILPGAQQAQETEPTPSVAEVKDTSPVVSETKVPIPQIVAITWQQGNTNTLEHSTAPMWAPDGVLLTDQQLTALRADAPGTERHHCSQPEFQAPHPLVFIFDVGSIGREIKNGVNVKCELPNGQTAGLGSWGVTEPGKVSADRFYTVSAAVGSRPYKGEFHWTESTNVHLKYPIEAPQVIQTFNTPVEKIEIAKGVTWIIDPKAGSDHGVPRAVASGEVVLGTEIPVIRSVGEPYPAAVLESIHDGSLDLVDYWVNVHLKESDQRLQEAQATHRERDGQLYTVRISKRFPDFKNVKRIDVCRQRYTVSVIKDVKIRTDLMPPVMK